MEHISSVVTDKRSAAKGPCWGLIDKTRREATMARRHFDYKYWEFVRIIPEFPCRQGDTWPT